MDTTFTKDTFIKGFKKCIIKLTKAYTILWLMATYIVARLYLKQIFELDFKVWESDLTAVSTVGYLIMTWKFYIQLIR